MVVKILSIIGAVWVILLVINTILAGIVTTIQKKDLNKFKTKVQTGKTMEEIFNKLTPEEIDKLKSGEEIKEKIDVVKPETILDKYADYKIKDIEKFTNKLDKWLTKRSDNISATHKDWFQILKSGDSCTDILTFEIQSNNIFVIFIKNDSNPVVTNICGFKKIGDLELLLRQVYNMKVLKKIDHSEK